MDLNDEAILDSFRQTKDPQKFKSLIKLYQNRIYNTAFHILGNAEEAEEVVQITCMKIHQNIDKFKRQSSFAAWVFRIAQNVCIDMVRKRQRRNGFQVWSLNNQSTDLQDSESHSQVVYQVADSSPNPEEKLDMKEQVHMLRKMLKLLPENQRSVVVLHDIEGFSYDEIATIVNSNTGTVRSRLHYGRLKLRQLLEPYYSYCGSSQTSG